jgi:thiamine-monophosphate kinase
MIPEFDFIGGIRGQMPVPEGVEFGIGDDAAVLSEKFDLLTTDMLVEGVHFRFDLGSAGDFGWRSLVASLSDIAAMGGEPGPFVASLAASPELEHEQAREMVDGMRSAAEECGVGDSSASIGGDLSGSPGATVLSIALLGTTTESGAIFRSGAAPGDRLVLVGKPGLSSAGLRVLEGEAPGLEAAHRERLVQSYRRPLARVEAGKWLGESGSVSALIDVSDGLAADLRHLTDASGVRARVELPAVPVDPALEAFGREVGENPGPLAVSGGEDFCLLASLPADRVDDVKRRADSADWSCEEIGAIVDGEPNITFVDGDGRSVDVSSGGFEHFVAGG